MENTATAQTANFHEEHQFMKCYMSVLRAIPFYPSVTFFYLLYLCEQEDSNSIQIQIKDLQDFLYLSRGKVTTALRQLQEYHLITLKRRSHGLQVQVHMDWETRIANILRDKGLSEEEIETLM